MHWTNRHDTASGSVQCTVVLSAAVAKIQFDTLSYALIESKKLAWIVGTLQPWCNHQSCQVIVPVRKCKYARTHCHRDNTVRDHTRRKCLYTDAALPKCSITSVCNVLLNRAVVTCVIALPQSPAHGRGKQYPSLRGRRTIIFLRRYRKSAVRGTAHTRTHKCYYDSWFSCLCRYLILKKVFSAVCIAWIFLGEKSRSRWSKIQ